MLFSERLFYFCLANAGSRFHSFLFLSYKIAQIYKHSPSVVTVDANCFRNIFSPRAIGRERDCKLFVYLIRGDFYAHNSSIKNNLELVVCIRYKEVKARICCSTAQKN